MKREGKLSRRSCKLSFYDKLRGKRCKNIEGFIEDKYGNMLIMEKE